MRTGRPRSSRGRAFALLALGAAGLGGCVGAFGPRGTWIKPGAYPDVAERDAYECEREAVRHATTDEPAAVVYERCIRARGYVRPGERAGAPGPDALPGGSR
jgi:hypothetical protein